MRLAIIESKVAGAEELWWLPFTGGGGGANWETEKGAASLPR